MSTGNKFQLSDTFKVAMVVWLTTGGMYYIKSEDAQITAALELRITDKLTAILDRVSKLDQKLEREILLTRKKIPYRLEEYDKGTKGE